MIEIITFIAATIYAIVTAKLIQSADRYREIFYSIIWPILLIIGLTSETVAWIRRWFNGR